MLVRVHVVVLAGLSLPISGGSFAAQQSRHPSGLHFRSAAKNQGVIASPSNASRVPRFDYRGSSKYPWGPGYNFPYPDRPYGDPDHW
jgi:hypothetical protein